MYLKEIPFEIDLAVAEISCNKQNKQTTRQRERTFFFIDSFNSRLHNAFSINLLFFHYKQTLEFGTIAGTAGTGNYQRWNRYF